MSLANESTEKLCEESDNDDLTSLRLEDRKPRQRLVSLSLVTLPFLAGAVITATLLSAIGLLNTDSIQSVDNNELPNILPGTDEATGQPASWFNGNCGSSATEARSRDCVFDLVSHSWLPQNCLYNEDFADAELMYANSTWHWGLDDTTEVSLENVRQGEFDRVWTSMDWHVTHCSYVWKRLHRALIDPGRRLDSYTADYHHTSHCVGMIAGLNPVAPLNGVGTRVYTKFPTC